MTAKIDRMEFTRQMYVAAHKEMNSHHKAEKELLSITTAIQEEVCGRLQSVYSVGDNLRSLHVYDCNYLIYLSSQHMRPMTIMIRDKLLELAKLTAPVELLDSINHRPIACQITPLYRYLNTYFRETHSEERFAGAIDIYEKPQITAHSEEHEYIQTPTAYVIRSNKNTLIVNDLAESDNYIRNPNKKAK